MSTFPGSPLTTSGVFTTIPPSRRSLESLSLSVAQLGGGSHVRPAQGGYTGMPEIWVDISMYLYNFVCEKLRDEHVIPCEYLTRTRRLAHQCRLRQCCLSHHTRRPLHLVYKPSTPTFPVKGNQIQPLTTLTLNGGTKDLKLSLALGYKHTILLRKPQKVID